MPLPTQYFWQAGYFIAYPVTQCPRIGKGCLIS